MSRKLTIFLALLAVAAIGAACQGTDDPGSGDGLASISGALTVDDAPAADVRVYVLGMPQLDDRTDGNGEFTIIGIPAGTHVLVAADGRGHGLQFEATAQEGGEQRVGTLPMRETGAIAGLVTVEGLDDATGTDVYVPGSSFLAKTDAAGRFFLLEVPAGRFTLRAERDGFRPAEVGVEVPAGGVGEAFLTLRRDCVPRAELCDGLDNDCDGLVDEEVCDAEPVLLVQPDFIDFGAVEVGATASASVVLVNAGGGDLVLQRVSLSAASDAVFALAGALPLPTTLAPGQVLDLALDFAPGAPGRYSGALAVAGDGVAATVALLGVGTAGCQPSLELCNGIDDDCDGLVDEGACDDPCTGVTCAPGEVCYGGQCHDPCWNQVCPQGEICNPLYGLCEPACEDLDGDGFCGVDDCDDRDPGVFPGAPDACGDRLDNDCDGLVDEDCSGCQPGATMSCGPYGVGTCTSGAIVCQDDGTWGQCEGAVWPMPELCDGLDNDCDGEIDEAGCDRPCTSDADCAAGEVCEGGLCVELCGCASDADCPADHICVNCQCLLDEQCTVEVCDGLDNDCDGMIDEGDVCGGTCVDGETRVCGSDVGACHSGAQVCARGLWSECQGAVGPSAEICDGLDNDCDGMVDEEGCGDPCRSDDECAAGQVCVDGLCVIDCEDNDADGYCDDDCNDSDASIHPGAAELCDAIDNDCDGQVDEGCPDTCTSDADCEAGEICESGMCTRPACCEDLEVAPATLDFGNVALGSTATGTILLQSVGGLDVVVSGIAFERLDNEAFMLDSVQTPVVLAPGQVLELTVLFVPYAEQSFSAALRIDSDDAEEPTIIVTLTGTGGAGCQPELELCDGLDNDCDGLVDEGDLCGDGLLCEDGECVEDQACTPDLDGDGYCRDDCDDLDDTINPGAAEICGDERDNDCDGEIDEGC